MEIVSVINYKGGVGKTTVTANLAAYLASQGKNVLLLDMDPQASLTFSFVAPDYWAKNLKAEKTIKQWFTKIINEECAESINEIIFTPKNVNDRLRHLNASSGRIDLIASHLDLINIDLDLASLIAGTGKIYETRFVKHHKKLRSALQNTLPNQFDIILIDCPPNFNVATMSALIASNRILIPAKPDYLSTLGIEYLQKSVRELVSKYNKSLEVVFNWNLSLKNAENAIAWV